ncbi:hypothetical protein BBO99_00003762 [Phytophthora kernoviae]|uniref:Uncharacterized protein n=2 Tax=Phytophthora kernoviae TaxID=325452 RepID=A0A3F2RSL6_9STRA|nr:hypothetical protein G195_004343 [Phytophthora kernoviae 00238/432]KAG2527526.1 hypothetical protein JM16_003423 [Phytophthora kernoviae]KAG2528794.1 hypothetical protein JM18_002996 [Phytophthora kernoviae]RLN45071.1 hypothetical protein BBI17_003838 [Phytophthora kernoviae]RLN63462.1 hypothetical protein BBP00_00004101 [Phytophthora kernoviae]
MSSAGDVAVPGQRLATADGKLKTGSGTYARDGGIFASIFGKWKISENTVEVTRAHKTLGSAQVLRLGDVEAFPGTIRLEDVRNHDIDKLVMEEVFSPNMLVKAAVLSFGDTRSYFLSTAKPGLGVVRQPAQQDSQATDMETD